MEWFAFVVEFGRKELMSFSNKYFSTSGVCITYISGPQNSTILESWDIKIGITVQACRKINCKVNKERLIKCARSKTSVVTEGDLNIFTALSSHGTQIFRNWSNLRGSSSQKTGNCW